MFFLPLHIFAANKAVHLLHRFETSANPLVSGEHNYPQIIKLPHLEFPLIWLSSNFAKDLDPKIKESLIFKNSKGEEYIRWVLAPTENEIGHPGKYTKIFNKDIIDFIASKKGDTQLHYYYTGYPTASTTYLLEDPNSKITFFIKTSNAAAPSGAYKAKRRSANEASDARLINDYLVQIQEIKPFKYFTFFQEPAAFTLSEIDMALIIRDSGDMKNFDSKFFYLPAFSITDEKIGKEIALRNSFTDPFVFWTAHLPKILASAMTELFLRTGLTLDSPHGQNYLFELDKNMKLTGRLVFRDLADVYVHHSFYDLYKDKYNLKKFSQKENILLFKHGVEISARPLETTSDHFPDSLFGHQWLPEQREIIRAWQKPFVDEVDRVIHEMTGIDPKIIELEEFKNHPDDKYIIYFKEGMYHRFLLDDSTSHWSTYLRQVNHEGALDINIISCKNIFK